MNLPVRYNLLVTLYIILVVFSQLLQGGKFDLLVHNVPGETNRSLSGSSPDATFFTVFVLSVCKLTVLRVLLKSCLGRTNQRKTYVWNKPFQAWVTLLSDMSVTIKEPAISIKGAIAKQKHTNPGWYWLSDGNVVNMGSQEHNPVSAWFTAHLLPVTFWTYHWQVITDSMYLRELKTSSCKM